MHLIYSGKRKIKINFKDKKQKYFRYIYVYLEYVQQQPIVNNNSNSSEGLSPCFEPKLVSLERSGTINVVTIIALISHFLPYFNSSINPIIYNIMSGM